MRIDLGSLLALGPGANSAADRATGLTAARGPLQTDGVARTGVAGAKAFAAVLAALVPSGSADASSPAAPAMSFGRGAAAAALPPKAGASLARGAAAASTHAAGPGAAAATPLASAGTTPIPAVLDEIIGTPKQDLKASGHSAESHSRLAEDAKVIESHLRADPPPFPVEAGRGDPLPQQASAQTAMATLAASATASTPGDRAPAPAKASSPAQEARAAPLARTTLAARAAAPGAQPTAAAGAAPARPDIETAAPTSTSTSSPTPTLSADQGPAAARPGAPARPQPQAKVAVEPASGATAPATPATADQPPSTTRQDGPPRAARPGLAVLPGDPATRPPSRATASAPVEPARPLAPERVAARQLPVAARLQQAGRRTVGDADAAEPVAGKPAHPAASHAPQGSTALAAPATPPPTPAAAADAPTVRAPAPSPQAGRALPPEPANGSLQGSITSGAAHLRLETESSGELALHLRVRDGVAHVRVEGEQAAQVARGAPELQRALAAEGLKLGSVEVEPRHAPPPPPTGDAGDAGRMAADQGQPQGRQAPAGDEAPAPHQPPAGAARRGETRATAHHVEA